MSLRPEVLNAFEVLGVDCDADEVVASRAYKKLALLHHPDRNHGDATSTARFQEIGAAWEICSRHYENPAWSHSSGTSLFDDDDDFSWGDIFGFEGRPMSFYEFLFQEELMNRKFRRSHAFRRGQPPFAFTFTFSTGSSYSGRGSDSSGGGIDNAARQKQEKEEYERRRRELEQEIEAEERQKRKTARQQKLNTEQRVSAQAEVFELARRGDSSAVKTIIEKHDLDVNAPERATKQQKKQRSPQTSFESILHVAGAHCDEELIQFLLDKGGNLTALNQENLTPLQASVLSGNVTVVHFLLSGRLKSEGCHPSKAALDGRTPLQLAIASNSVSMVELLLKDATVHDVQKCWERPSLPPDIKKVLETKNGFVPVDKAGSEPTMSRKALVKAEAARKQATLLEEKKKKIAEERERAAENMRKKKERAAKRDMAARAVEARRQEEEHVQIEERRRAEEERKSEAARQEVLHRVELKERVKTEEKARKEWQEKQRREEEAHVRKEQEALLQIQRKGEEEVRTREQESRRRVEEGEDQKASENQLQRKREQEDAQRAADAAQRHVDTPQGEYREPKPQSRQGLQNRPIEEHKQQQVPYAIRKRANQDPEAKRAEGLRRLLAQAEEHKRQRERLEQAAKGPEVVSSSPQVSQVTSSPNPVQEAIMRKRAEQSARDKARYQRMKEEKVKEKEVSGASGSTNDEQRFSKTVPNTISSCPHTPSSLSPSPLSRSEETRPCETETTFSYVPPSPPMTPEDMQTCTIPDDLFAYEPPRPAAGHADFRGRGRGRGQGRGRGRVYHSGQ